MGVEDCSCYLGLQERDTSHFPQRMIMWTGSVRERNGEHTGWLDTSHFLRRITMWTGSAGKRNGKHGWL